MAKSFYNPAERSIQNGDGSGYFKYNEGSGLVELEPKRYGHPLFNVIVEEIKALHEEKNRQYASGDDPLGNFRRTGQIISKLLKPGIDPSLASCLAFMSKQVDGVYELFGESKENTIDSLEDKLQDIAIYSIIGMIMVRESRTKSNPDSGSR